MNENRHRTLLTLFRGDNRNSCVLFLYSLEPKPITRRLTMGRKASPIPLPDACTSTQAVLLSSQVISRSTCDTRRQRRAGGWRDGQGKIRLETGAFFGGFQKA